MTIECGASTQTSDSALFDDSAMLEVAITTSDPLEATGDGALESQVISQNEPSENVEIGAGAVNAKSLVACPTRITAGLNG